MRQTSREREGLPRPTLCPRSLSFPVRRDEDRSGLPMCCNRDPVVLPRGDADDPQRGHDLMDYLTQLDGPLRQLAGEWQETLERWQAAGRRVPPAMIIICNDRRWPRSSTATSPCGARCRPS